MRRVACCSLPVTYLFEARVLCLMRRFSMLVSLVSYLVFRFSLLVFRISCLLEVARCRGCQRLLEVAKGHRQNRRGGHGSVQQIRQRRVLREFLHTSHSNGYIRPRCSHAPVQRGKDLVAAGVHKRWGYPHKAAQNGHADSKYGVSWQRHLVCGGLARQFVVSWQDTWVR